MVLVEPALEPEAGDSKGPVLVGVVGVHAGVGRLGGAPRPPLSPGVGDLRLDCERARLGEQRALLAPHQETGHQVFEHRPAPRQERRRTVHPRHGAAERVPVRLGDVALDDRQVAREARLRREEVVVVRVGLVDRRVVADAEELPVAVVEQLEVHPLRLFVGASGERGELRDERRGVGVRGSKRPVEALCRRVELRRGLPAPTSLALGRAEIDAKGPRDAGEISPTGPRWGARSRA